MTDLEALREKAVEAMKRGDWHSRSCWVCNPAHEHMKFYDDIVLHCFACGHWYFEAIDITLTDEVT